MIAAARDFGAAFVHTCPEQELFHSDKMLKFQARFLQFRPVISTTSGRK